MRAGANQSKEEAEKLGDRKDDSLSLGTICVSHTTLWGGDDVLNLRHILMPFTFLRQGTSLSPQRGGLCEAHIIMARGQCLLLHC